VVRIGVTGHLDLTPSSVPLVRHAIGAVLAPYVPRGLTGVSCIAAGADTIFAEVVLDLAGDLEVIIPAADYRERKVEPDHADLFDRLVARAAKVHRMPRDVSDQWAYAAANEFLVDSVDRMVAVWDGSVPADRGGTGAVVQYARSLGLDIEVIWPDGAARRSRS
jgi:hypothetical protein